MYTLFSAASIDNPRFVEKWKNKVDSIRDEYLKLEGEIEFIKSKLDSNLTIKTKKDELYFVVSEYYEILQLMIEDSATQRIIKEQQKTIQSNNLSRANLNLLLNKISVSTYYTLQYLFKKIHI